MIAVATRNTTRQLVPGPGTIRPPDPPGSDGLMIWPTGASSPIGPWSPNDD
jgi:hypothetical protein